MAIPASIVASAVFLFFGWVVVQWVPELMVLFWLVVAPIAAYLLVGRLLLDVYMRRGIQYLITDRQVIIVGRGLRAVTNCIPLHSLYRRVDHRDGTATFWFDHVPWLGFADFPWGSWFTHLDHVGPPEEVVSLIGGRVHRPPLGWPLQP